jgi:ectoine hydroxylase-related dioxygenase (phytanoyl-CoA dioxygenase family)
MSATTHPIHLSDEDVTFFEREGYFIYHHQLFAQEQLKRLQAFFDQMLADLPDGARPESMDTPHFAFPALFEWLLADEVLDFVERFIGSDILLWSSHFLCKPPGVGLAVPWHEDSSYWGDALSEHKVVTVWVGVDDSQPENGCMRVIPGSHSNGFSEYEDVDRSTNVFPTRIKPGEMDESAAVDLAIMAGECHVHHAKMIHGSNPNTSDRRRCGYTMRYMPADVKHNVDEQGGQHAVYLARGENLAGNELGDPTKLFEPGQDRWRGGAGH